MGAPAPHRRAVAAGPGCQVSRSRRLTAPQSWFAAIDFTDATAAAARIASEFDGWAPELTALITHSDTPPVLRPLYTLPTGHRWDRVPGVTLLGDAAHLTAPNGEGANLAMYDGSELAKAIAAHPGDAETALTEYEQVMFARSAEAAADGSQGHELLFGEGTPYALLGMDTDGRPSSHRG